MNEQFLKKLSHYVGMLPIGAVFGLVAFMACIEIKDLDLWLHLGMGRFTVQHGFVPDVDILSATIAGTPWINHEWLFQVILFGIYNVWGAEGLIRMQVGIVLLTMLILLFLGYSKDKQFMTAFGLFLVFLIYVQRFTIRPDIFSLLFFAVYIFILAIHIDKKWSVFALFVVQILWSNIHGYFFFGPLFVLIALFSEWLKRHGPLPYEWNKVGRLTDEEYRRLKLIFCAVMVACLVNPYFFKGALYPLSVLFSLSGEDKIFFKYIQELQRPVTWGTIFADTQFIYYKLFIFVSFVSFVLNRYRIDISALIFWIVFLFFSLTAARNAAFFAFAAYLVLITNSLNFSFRDILPIRFTTKRFQHLTAIMAKFLFLIWLFHFSEGITGQAYYDFEQYETKSLFGGVSKTGFPHKAVNFLVENKVKGNFFNDFNVGAYLVGHTFPDIKVFIDGRTEVYGGKFFERYRKIWEEGNAELFEQAVEKHQLTGAFLSSVQQRIPKKILNYLYKHDQWQLVYFDYDGVIFLKNDYLENKPIIEKFSLDLASWQPPQLDLLKLGPEKDFPYHYYYRAYTLESLDLDDQALAEAQEAIQINPGYAECYDTIGRIYAKKKDFKKAFEQFRLAVKFSPYNRDFRHNLAQSYFDLGEFEYAQKQYETIVTLWPQDPRGYFFLAKSWIKNKKFQEAMETLKKAHTLNPQNSADLVALGDLFVEENQTKEAEEVYRWALTTGSEAVGIHQKLGALFKSQGKLEQAKKEWTEALSLDPENEAIKSLLNEIGP